MAKESWVNINNTWKKCKAVYININGVWKRTVPKGIINSIWKEFIEYFLSKIVTEYRELIGHTNFSNTIIYNQDGYNGTLSKSGNVENLGSIVVSGSYTPADSKTVYSSSTKPSGDNTHPSSVYYNSEGYSGTLTPYRTSFNSDLTMTTLHYSGIVTKPATDTRVWQNKYKQKYEGEVKKLI